MTQIRSVEQAAGRKTAEVSATSLTPPPASEPPFTAAEWQAFRSQDWHAGAAIVGLMVAIFSIGVALYTVIALIAATGG
jgi:hypothetical protein